MKNTLLFLLTFFWSVNLFSQEQLREFNEILGAEQSSAFDQAVDSYIKFLDLNYADQDSLTDQNSQFLKDIQNIYSSGPPDWKFPSDVEAVLNQWEKSGLRKEIRLWPNEHYQPSHLVDFDDNDSTNSEKLEIEIDDEIIPILDSDGKVIAEAESTDSSLVTNTIGKFLFALDQCCSADTLINKYVEVKLRVGDISPSLIAGGYLEFGERLHEPIVIRMIVAELYYFLMRRGIEMKKLGRSSNSK